MFRKHRLNDKFFDVIDTPEKAYWLGFIYADGSVIISNKYRTCKLQIQLRESDKQHLEKLKYILNTDYPLTYLSKYKKYAIQIHSKRLVTRLRDLLKDPLSHINDELLSHFVRGVFDGDGCVYLKKCNHDTIGKTVGVDITGEANFIINLQKRIMVQLFPNYKKAGNVCKVSNSKNCYSLRYLGSKAIKLLCWIYKDSTYYTRLDRKFELYNNIMRWFITVKNKTSEILYSHIYKAEKLLESGLSTRKVAKILKLGSTTIHYYSKKFKYGACISVIKNYKPRIGTIRDWDGKVW